LEMIKLAEGDGNTSKKRFLSHTTRPVDETISTGQASLMT
jgi:hypothetical protein